MRGEWFILTNPTTGGMGGLQVAATVVERPLALAPGSMR